ncbi:ABC transporter ATP-binding protein [Polluticaenibacter yanchengensis]|uniref:ABC transporter ATP-binding protein n=1 Tax=Polluticaenibacter yanchengensis TaxID=3014562 RepID=A0ABT4UQ53_9BACT|nr:ABC transporter ATP-binding protein [Chitinophagaceae bacterium LY-5]
MDVLSINEILLIEKKTKAIEYLVASGISISIYFIVKSYGAIVAEKQSFLIGERMNEKLLVKATAAPYSYFEDPNFYNLLQRAQNGGGNRPSLYFLHGIELAKNITTIIAVSSILFIIDGWLPVLLLLFIVPVIVVKLKFSRKMDNLQIENTANERWSKYYTEVLTTNTHAKEVRTFNLSRYLILKLKNINFLKHKQQIALQYKQAKTEALTTVLSYTGIYTCILYITIKSLNNAANPADISLFLIVFTQIITLLYATSQSVLRLYQDNLQMTHISNFLHYKYDHDLSLKEKQGQGFEHLILKDIFFAYPGKNDCLSNINMVFERGKTIAIVGLNGAGKSTLLKIILGLYHPTDGQMILNNRVVVNSEYLRLEATAVFQDYSRFNFTLKECICLGNTDQPFDEPLFNKACQVSGIDSIMKHLPAGINTLLGNVFPGGKELSLGQWQKIALARCLYSNRSIIILDEASSAFDAHSEHQLFKDLKAYYPDKTFIIVSHRYHTVKNADNIYVLENGGIIEEGESKALISKNGYYSSIFNLARS